MGGGREGGTNMQKHPGLLFHGGARQTKRGAGFVVVSFSDKEIRFLVKRFALVLLQVRTLLQFPNTRIYAINLYFCSKNEIRSFMIFNYCKDTQG